MHETYEKQTLASTMDVKSILVYILVSALELQRA